VEYWNSSPVFQVEILNLQPSEPLRSQVQELLERSRAGTLSAQEEQDWERYEYIWSTSLGWRSQRPA
jgi:hypothetical protein